MVAIVLSVVNVGHGTVVCCLSRLCLRAGDVLGVLEDINKAKMKRGSIRIEEFEKYIELIPGRLGFGCAPNTAHLNELALHYKVNVIVNIRQPHPKALWYQNKTRAQVLHIPLELPRTADTRKDLVDSNKLIEAARQVSGILLKDPKKHVYIHGFDAYNYTSVFALLVWTFAQPQFNDFDPLKELETMYGVDLVRDFPSYERHREQLTNIIRESRKDIFSAFARGNNKKHKHEQQQQHKDGADSGPSDIQGGQPGETPGNFGNDTTAPGGTGKDSQKGV